MYPFSHSMQIISSNLKSSNIVETFMLLTQRLTSGNGNYYSVFMAAIKQMRNNIKILIW